MATNHDNARNECKSEYFAFTDEIRVNQKEWEPCFMASSRKVKNNASMKFSWFNWAAFIPMTWINYHFEPATKLL